MGGGVRSANLGSHGYPGAGQVGEARAGDHLGNHGSHDIQCAPLTELGPAGV